MIRYELFQKWWQGATSGPSEFLIDKRSAEIGFEAALDIMEKSLASRDVIETPKPSIDKRLH